MSAEFDLKHCPLGLSLQIAFGDRGPATHYYIEAPDSELNGNRTTLTLYRLEPKTKGGVPFLTPIGPDIAAALVEEWLAKAPYPPKPYTDGSAIKSHRVVDGVWDWTIICCVEPIWEVFGK